MATLLEISQKSSTQLNDLEREIVREIIGITGDAGSVNYQDSNARMIALQPSQNQIVRVLLDQYLEDIGFDTTRVEGGSQGVDYNPLRDKEAIVDELNRIVYGVANTDDDNLQGGALQFIPVTYSSGSSDLE